MTFSARLEWRIYARFLRGRSIEDLASEFRAGRLDIEQVIRAVHGRIRRPEGEDEDKWQEGVSA